MLRNCNVIHPLNRSTARQCLERGANRLGERQIRREALHGDERLLVAIAKRDQRIDHIAPSLGRRFTHRFGELAFELEQQPLGGFLADARDPHEARRVLQRNRLREVADRHAGKHRERSARRDARYTDQLAEHRALFCAREAIKEMRILAHDEVREEGYRCAGGWQRIKGAHRHIELIAHAADLHQDLRRVLGGQLAGQMPDQTSLPFRIRNPRSGRSPSLAPCAWQMAQASASAASSEGSPGSSSRRRTMCCTCSLAAWPLPTTDCLTCSAVYSATGRPASSAAQIAVPRAWPRASVDCGLTFTKTFSTATAVGAWAAITSRSPSRMAFRRMARSPSPDFTQPLVMYCSPDARTSITPKPVSLRPGSIPRILSRLPPSYRRPGRRRGSRARRSGCAGGPAGRRAGPSRSSASR